MQRGFWGDGGRGEVTEGHMAEGPKSRRAICTIAIGYLPNPDRPRALSAPHTNFSVKSLLFDLRKGKRNGNVPNLPDSLPLLVYCS